MNSQTAVERAAEMGTYAGAAVSVSLWGLSVSEIAVTASAVFAGLSFLVHLWLSVRRDRREQIKAKLETARLSHLIGEKDGEPRAYDGDASRSVRDVGEG